MREAMLIVHFLGLAMGIGTSIGFMFLGIAGSKMEKEEGLKFAINTFALSRMGHIGLTLLVISGLYLMTPFWGTLNTQALLIAKLALVLTLIVTITIVTIASNKVKKGDAARMKQIMVLGRVALLTGLAIVVLAVLVF
jgi:hypothetical protein